ncbi:MAG: serpin family protein [Butyrivibrio sp.]|nr:serpin family protein [Acetatifactor muris]MCM1559325.1 serpin family protein [Butyrivibrio sp.]
MKITKSAINGILYRGICGGVCAALTLAALAGCGNGSSSRNLMNEVSAGRESAGGSSAETDGGSVSSAQTGGSQADGDSAYSGGGGQTDGGSTIEGAQAGDGRAYADSSASADGGSAARRLPSADAVTYTDFAVRLFQECTRSRTEGNVLVSPLSVINALAMTANGARGETLEQMEELLGADLNSLCSYLSSYNRSLPAGEKQKLHSADSIWIKEDKSFTASPDFLQANAEWFGADVYMAPFDASTLKDINRWVSENTDEMIPEILDEIPADAVMYLVNALAFDAEWQSVYKEYQIREGTFTLEDGTVQDAEMMYSTEYTWLQDTQAQGFVKYYYDTGYAFAALLPDEGVSLADYTASLTGERLHELLSDTASPSPSVEAAIPKFKSEYSVSLNDILENLGMTDAFDSDRADLSGLGSSPDGTLYISRVLHKTFIALDEKGTRAGAATAVEIVKESAAINPLESKTVYLDRPFVYMIIDCEENLPVFMGTVTELEQ